jgi:hypothetical protein
MIFADMKYIYNIISYIAYIEAQYVLLKRF